MRCFGGEALPSARQVNKYIRQESRDGQRGRCSKCLEAVRSRPFVCENEATARRITIPGLTKSQVSNYVIFPQLREWKPSAVASPHVAVAAIITGIEPRTCADTTRTTFGIISQPNRLRRCSNGEAARSALSIELSTGTVVSRGDGCSNASCRAGIALGWQRIVQPRLLFGAKSGRIELLGQASLIRFRVTCRY